jgi:hypothetical protein
MLHIYAALAEKEWRLISERATMKGTFCVIKPEMKCTTCSCISRACAGLKRAKDEGKRRPQSADIPKPLYRAIDRRAFLAVMRGRRLRRRKGG